MKSSLKKLLTVILLAITICLIISPNSVQAGDVTSCRREGQCVDGSVCDCLAWSGTTCVSWGFNDGESCGAAIIGRIERPAGVDKFSFSGSGYASIGLINFANRVLQLITIVAGIWVMFNFIMAGWIYLTAFGSTSAHGEVRDKLTYTVVGIAIIAGAYTIAALIGLIFFGRADFILRPELQTPIVPGP